MTDKKISYSIFDPTGNITALVETRVDISCQPSVAAMLMEKHPEVEQVGFVELKHDRVKNCVHGSLRMAGGEFCGNAAMSAAALCFLRHEGDQSASTIRLNVSGSREPVEVRLEREGRHPSESSLPCPETHAAFYAGIQMPPALSISSRQFACEEISGCLPVVFMEGISHIIVEQDKSGDFFTLLKDPQRAEAALRRWCNELKTDGLGLMFLEGSSFDYQLTPLVYIPGSNTVFWENSCASGSAATGMYLAAGSDTFQELMLKEPGGVLKVESHPGTGETWLYGRTCMKGNYIV